MLQSVATCCSANLPIPVAGSNLLGEDSLHSPNFFSEISNLGILKSREIILLCSFLGAVAKIHEFPKYLNGSFQKRNV